MIFEFQLAERVYLKTDPEQLERIVIGYIVRKNSITYGLVSGTQESWHYDFEINRDKIY